MNRYKGVMFHHGKTQKYNQATVKQAVYDYHNRKQLGLTVARVAEKYHMSVTLLYQKVHLLNLNSSSKRLSRRANLYLFNRNALELIHNGGRLFTGLRTSLIDTETILQNGEIPDVLPSDVEILMHLKRGLQYVMQHRGPLTLKVIQNINALVAYNSYEPGHFALVPMHINGIKWQPPKPSPKRARKFIKHYKQNGDSPSITAIKIMLQFDRYQFFWNGNKRTGWLVANYYLLQHGAGVLNITQKQAHKWNQLLAQFYETGKINRIAYWVNRNCITNKI